MDIYTKFFLVFGVFVLLLGIAFFAYEWLKSRKAKSLSVPHLKLLKDPSSNTRMKAVIALGEIGHESSVPSLVKSLKDTDTSVRELAALALGKIANIHSLKSLAYTAVHDDAPSVRTTAVKALQAIGGRYLRSIKETEGLNSINAAQRANSLQDLIDTYIVPGLMLAMEDDEITIRDLSEAALKKLRIAQTLEFQKEAPADNVQFSAFYPSSVTGDVWEDLFVYAHLEGRDIEVESDLKAAASWLEEKIFKSKKAKETTQLRQGTRITVTPEGSAVQFEHPSMTKIWTGSSIRFKFRFKLSGDLSDENILVHIPIRVEGIEIAQIQISIGIEKGKSQFTVLGRKVENPLAEAKRNSQTTGIYQKIFVSYSRRDKEVVEAYRFAQLALGNDVFMDTYSIRSGEDWRAALANAIDTADVFQLFWSSDSSASSNVRDEWDYALTYKCPHTHCTDFIRPVYWVTPIPAQPPTELSHLNFKYVPLKERFRPEE